MPDVTVHVDSGGNADNPGVARDKTIQWVLDPGAAGPFSLVPPRNMFEKDDNPKCFTLSSQTPDSPTYTVKHGASVGDHSYTINPGACAKKDHRPYTGPQKITVTT